MNVYTYTIDVTSLVSFGRPESEELPLTKCVCGEEFLLWDVVVNVKLERSNSCWACGRKFRFVRNEGYNSGIKVLEEVQL